MKTSIRLLPAVAIIGMIAWWMIGAFQQRGLRAWKSDADGNEIRFHSVTDDINPRLVARISFRQRLSDAWADKSIGKFWAHSETSERVLFTKPTLCVWFELRAGKSAPVNPATRTRIPNLRHRTPEDARLILPDGQAIRSSRGAGASDRMVRFYRGVVFPMLPVRAKTLRFAGRLEGQSFDFDFLNPAYRPSLPVWKAAPLPQTVSRGKITLTLEALEIVPNPVEGGASSWSAKARWSISDTANNSPSRYLISEVYEDPAGNVDGGCGLLSEPTWKIRATVRRTPNFPYEESDVLPIGTIDPKKAFFVTFRGN